MLEGITERPKTLFLLKFTKALIKNVENEEIIELQTLLEKTKLKREKREKIQEVHKEDTLKKELRKTREIKPLEFPQRRQILEQPQIPLTPRQITPKQHILPHRTPSQRVVHRFKRLPTLRIPEPKLPPRFQYLHPTRAVVKSPLNLGQLNVFITNRATQSVECNGPNQPIIIRNPGEQKTQISLTKEEIDKVIEAFSKATKIPISEGVYKVAFGNLTLLAVISEEVGSKFIIKNIPRHTQIRRM